MKLSLFIAGRYLFARKSHNVINVISAISITGMAIGTAALILILSVYNGFDGIIKKSISDLCPDLKIVPSAGKRFVPDRDERTFIEHLPEVKGVSPSIEENVFLSYGERQAVARAIGVDSLFMKQSALANHLIEGDWRLGLGDLDECILGSGLAWETGARPQFNLPLKIYYPKHGAAVSAINPMGSVKSIELWQSGTVAVDGQDDKTLLLLDIDVLAGLMGCEGEISAWSVTLNDSRTIRKTARRIERELGPDFRVLDRYMQNPDIYRMMRYEKLAIYGILIFVIIIIAFNIFGSLSMLIIEKKEDIATLRAMGADDSLIGRIFVLEGWLQSLTGLAAGLLAGLTLCILQQKFGLVKMPGSYLIDAYPVIIKFSDILWTALGVSATGYVIAAIARRHTSDPRQGAR